MKRTLIVGSAVAAFVFAPSVSASPWRTCTKSVHNGLYVEMNTYGNISCATAQSAFNNLPNGSRFTKGWSPSTRRWVYFHCQWKTGFVGCFGPPGTGISLGWFKVSGSSGSSSGGGSTYVDTGSGHWIDDVSASGATITLEDGSTWIVDPLDRVDASLWLTVDDITVLDDYCSPGYEYALVNTDEGEKVCANYVGGA